MKQKTKTRKGQFVCVRMWNSYSKQSCSVGTVLSLIRNMMDGVTLVSYLSTNLLIIIMNRATDIR
jgi:ribosomal protein L6P/L9E